MYFSRKSALLLLEHALGLYFADFANNSEGYECMRAYQVQVCAHYLITFLVKTTKMHSLTCFFHCFPDAGGGTPCRGGAKTGIKT
jgi:hypothetical protein